MEFFLFFPHALCKSTGHAIVSPAEDPSQLVWIIETLLY